MVENTVPFYDFKTKKITQIPASELTPGLVQVKIQGTNEVVWADIRNIKLSPVRHPPFDERGMELIRKIEATFREFHPIPVEEWSQGFRRDGHPYHEIALWLYAGRIYEFFTKDESSADRRKEIFVIIMNCLNASYEGVRLTLPKLSMSDEDVQKVIDKFYAKNDDQKEQV